MGSILNEHIPLISDFLIVGLYYQLNYMQRQASYGPLSGNHDIYCVRAVSAGRKQGLGLRFRNITTVQVATCVTGLSSTVQRY